MRPNWTHVSLLAVAFVAVAAGLMLLQSPGAGNAVEEHDIAVKKVKQVGPKTNVSGGTSTYKVILQNKLPIVSDPEPVEVGIQVGVLGGCAGATIGNVSGLTGVTVSGSVTKGLISVGGFLADNDVSFDVTYPACGSTGGSADYSILVDACHSDDATGLFGAGPCGAAADDGEDNNISNDATLTLVIDAD